jgi:hypothetical protein
LFQGIVHLRLLHAVGELGDGGVDDGEEAGKRRRRTHELNPEATLEASLEALNVKKFDLAFTVDPLFQKTSAQFDEGGAKGARPPAQAARSSSASWARRAPLRRFAAV